ncbi:MAG: hypothetical protein ACLUD0_14565 [Eubacterium ramulus]
MTASANTMPESNPDRFLAQDYTGRSEILVVGVPESGNAAALGYAMESGIPHTVPHLSNSCDYGRTTAFHQAETEQTESRVSA